MSSKLAIACAVAMACLPLPAQAHDIYTGLINHDGNSCCDEKDCRPALYRVSAEGVQMIVDGGWLHVADDKIQYRALRGDTGETGGGHWCGYLDADLQTWVTRCAFLPPQSASGLRRPQHLGGASRHLITVPTEKLWAPR
jgi:hypothetical protein